MVEANKRKIKCFVVGGSEYSKIYDFIENSENCTDIKLADIVIFTGGEDISNEIYKRDKHPMTSGINKFRDEFEITMFKVARTLKKPMFGICRGAQLLGALSGATLVQHQLGSFSSHIIVTSTGEEIMTTHAHHQSLDLTDVKPLDYELLAWDDYEKTTCYGESWEDIIVRDKHPEFVWFPKTRCLCYQGHPEWMSDKGYKPTLAYINRIIKEKLNL